MKGQDQEGDTPAGMPGGKAALRQQMFEMARQPLSQDEVESVAFQAGGGSDAAEAAALQPAQQYPGDALPAPPRKSRRGLRKVYRRKLPPEE